VDEARAKRKLAAIFCADVKGYSRLMADDEEATVRTITAYREVMTGLAKEHRGKVVDAKGDNVLAEFASVVDAVRCAVEVQKELKEKNSELPEHRRMEFRIGINLGDVIEEEGAIYGDGVNIAARIEALAEGGGICISRTSFDQIKNKLNRKYEYLGEHAVKNIAEPVRVYKVLMEPRTSILETSRELKLPETPSIAVLPFVNMSADPEQEYFSDGITEDIITNLSKVSTLFVVSRNSSFFYKGKQVKIEEVARELGVQYILEGSVRQAGSRVRITAQLIDGSKGRHVWADKYDRELKDIFAVQDEVTQKVVSELALSLRATESDRLARKHTESFEAYDMYLRAFREQDVLKKENYLKSIEMSQRVIDLDPKFAGGYQLQSVAFSRAIRLGWSETPHEDMEKALELAQKAISVDDQFPASYMALASVYLIEGKQDEAVDAANRAATLVPGDSDTILYYGFYLHWAGRGPEAVDAVKKSMELNPMYLHGRFPGYLDFMGYACFTAGLYKEAIEAMKRAIHRYGPAPARHPFLIASYSALGSMEEAKEAARQWLKANPSFNLSSWGFGHLYKRSEDRERLYEALRKAGLK